MAGVKGRSGRKSNRDEAKRLAVIEKSWDLISELLNSQDKKRFDVARDVVVKDIAQTVKNEGDALVDQSKHITITYKVTDGIKPTPQSDDGIHGQSSVPGIECREKMGKVNTCDK